MVTLSESLTSDKAGCVLARRSHGQRSTKSEHELGNPNLQGAGKCRRTGVEWGGRGVEWGGRGVEWGGRGNSLAWQQPARQQPARQQPALSSLLARTEPRSPGRGQGFVASGIERPSALSQGRLRRLTRAIATRFPFRGLSRRAGTERRERRARLELTTSRSCCSASRSATLRSSVVDPLRGVGSLPGAPFELPLVGLCRRLRRHRAGRRRTSSLASEAHCAQRSLRSPTSPALLLAAPTTVLLGRVLSGLRRPRARPPAVARTSCSSTSRCSASRRPSRAAVLPALIGGDRSRRPRPRGRPSSSRCSRRTCVSTLVGDRRDHRVQRLARTTDGPAGARRSARSSASPTRRSASSSSGPLGRDATRAARLAWSARCCSACTARTRG